MSRCYAVPAFEAWTLLAAMAAVSAGAAASAQKRHELEYALFRSREVLEGDVDALVEARNENKRFMAFLFHEIRAPLSVISLGIPVLRDHAFGTATRATKDAPRGSDVDEADDRDFALETADLMAGSMDIVQRVLGDVLDLMHNTEQRQATLAPQWTSLRALVDSALESAEPMFERCLLYTSPSPRDQRGSRMPSSA